MNTKSKIGRGRGDQYWLLHHVEGGRGNFLVFFGLQVDRIQVFVPKGKAIHTFECLVHACFGRPKESLINKIG